jgi:hypothetical protein
VATVPKSLEKPPVALATVPTTATPDCAAQRFVLNDIDWATYDALGDLLLDRHIRMTYDGANLELMTTSPEHECHSCRSRNWCDSFSNAARKAIPKLSAIFRRGFANR